MKQTTLFGTPTNQTSALQPSHSNQNGKKNARKSIDLKQSPRVALSDYFKNSFKINCSPENDKKSQEVLEIEENANNNLTKSPITTITEDISIVSIDSHSKDLNAKRNSNEETKNAKNEQNNKPKIHSNQITSHFQPKKVLDFETVANPNSETCEDERSLLKRKSKLKETIEFQNGNIVKIEKFSNILMLTEFFDDFSDVFELNSKDSFSPPKFHAFFEAIQTCNASENIKVLAPILIRFINILISSPLPYFDKKLEDIPVSELNVSSILWLYFKQKNRNEVVKYFNKDFFCLPCDDKISILCLLTEDLMSLNEFRTFYEERVSNVDNLKRKLKYLNEDMKNFEREQMALKLYRTESQKNNPNAENDVDKENIDNNPNQQSTEEDIDTRLQRVLLGINNTQRELNKVRNKILKCDSICCNRKKIGTDSCGRNYYKLNSYSEKAILVEMDKQMQTIFGDKTSKESRKLSEQPQGDTIICITEDIQNCTIKTSENSTENVNKEDETQNDVMTSQNLSHMTPNDENIVWMEYNREEDLKHLSRFLKADSCGKKFSPRIEELITTLTDTSQAGETVEDVKEIQTHFLRSTQKNNTNCINQFTMGEFIQQLLDFADELFMSSLVSTKMQYTTWSDELAAAEVESSDFRRMLSKLVTLINHLLPSSTSQIELKTILTDYTTNSPCTLSQLFILLNYFEKNIDRTNSRYGLSCKKCLKRFCWDGVKYTPLVQCIKCSRAYHITCQNPPLEDITLDCECNRCDNPNSFNTNSFYKTRNDVSDGDDSSEVEEVNERKKSLRSRKSFLIKSNDEYSSSPEQESKREKKRKYNVISSESEDQSPLTKRKGLRRFTFQPFQKKLQPKPNDYTSKLRSSCF